MKKTALLVIAIGVISTLLSACGGDDASEPSSTATSQNTAPSRERNIERGPAKAALQQYLDREDPAKKIPKIVGQVQNEGYGLSLIVDGRSPEAFQESLALIASDTSPDQYRELDSALRYLQVYSSDGWAGLPGFYERLDGLTGEEIIERAEQLKRERGR